MKIIRTQGCIPDIGNKAVYYSAKTKYAELYKAKLCESLKLIKCNKKNIIVS